MASLSIPAAGRPLTNWAGNQRYAAAAFAAPTSPDEVAEIVRSSERVKAVGSRHSFSGVGDTDGTLISTERLRSIDTVDGRGCVRVGAGATFTELGQRLQRDGRSLSNLASLPHLSVAGAVATATHGSGYALPCLSAAVCALEFVAADGSQRVIERGAATFDGLVVSLGALGVVTAVTLQTVPAFDLRQQVFEDLPWSYAENELVNLLGVGHSISLFLSWTGEFIEQAWIKSSELLTAVVPARPAAAPRHPIRGGDPASCTEQMGVPGPACERLPHFRGDGVPSAGDELQSEYAVAIDDAVSAAMALRRIGDEIAPALHVSEIRVVAPDDFWLSPFYRRRSATFHFTWKQTPAAVEAIARVEDALREWKPRPHWGKLFGYDSRYLRGVFPRLGNFLDLHRELDPCGKFANPFLERLERTI